MSAPRIAKLNSFDLEPTSEAARQWVCAFASGDIRRPLPQGEVDWEEVFHAVCRHGLAGLAHRHLKAQASDTSPPAEFREWIKQAFVFSSLHMATVYRTIRRVIGPLAAAGVDFLVVKGPAVAQSVYPDRQLRAFGDLDIVVRERDWARVRQELLGLGLLPREELPEPPPKLIPQMVLHGTHFWDPNAQFLVEVHYDDLLESGLAARDVEGFWDRAITIEVDGVPIKALSLEDQLVQLSAHVHHHAFTRLNWLSDIAFILRDHGARLDWQQVIRTVRREEAQVPVYYTLRCVEQLLGVSAPPEVMEAIKPDAFRRWLHRRYLPDEQILSLRPGPYPLFSFYFLPLFDRLVPDLLVMGRRKEKIAGLVRLVHPPAEWLRHYYRVPERSPVEAHYLLHPIKLGYYYVSQVATAALRIVTHGWGRRHSNGVTTVWWSYDTTRPVLGNPETLLKGIEKRISTLQSRVAAARGVAA